MLGKLNCRMGAVTEVLIVSHVGLVTAFAFVLTDKFVVD
jgi:hypothetical protein